MVPLLIIPRKGQHQSEMALVQTVSWAKQDSKFAASKRKLYANIDIEYIKVGYNDGDCECAQSGGMPIVSAHS